jgi:hypothetical protein
MVIDPDIFALTDISELFTLNLQGKNLAACRKKTSWDTSMMIMDCAKLRHWNIESILKRLATKEVDYVNIMSLNSEPADSILEMPRIWNNLDTLTPETKMIHMTDRMTQPWKTGLKIDFTRNKMPKIAGIIPREWVQKMRGKYVSTYQPHPNKEIEKFFFGIVTDALRDGVITRDQIKQEIEKKNVRSDLFSKIES